jgi:hypothetical protein
MDGSQITVRKLFYQPIILDGFKPSRKNRLDLFPDGFFPISGRFEIPFFFVVYSEILFLEK